MSNPHSKFTQYRDDDMPPPGKDLRGQKFGLLSPLKYLGKCGSSYAWSCACSCGKGKVVKAYALQKGRVRSCGCLVGRPRA